MGDPIPRVVEAKYARAFRIWLKFDDGSQGEIDFEAELTGAIFEPLRDIEEFRRLRVDPDLDTIAWPNGADVCPSYLYDMVKLASRSESASKDPTA